MTHETAIETLCRWDCQFNTWNWPDDFPHPKPPGFDDLPCWSRDQSIETKALHMRPYLNAIAQLVPFKVCLKYWNTVYRKDPGQMTDDEFETWWTEQHRKVAEENGADPAVTVTL